MSSQQAMFRIGRIMQLVAVNQGRRTIHCSASLSGVVDSKNEVAPIYAKLKAKQERFQIPDDTPVHLKGGVMDRVLLGVTMVLIGVGVIASAEYIYTSAYPKKA